MVNEQDSSYQHSEWRTDAFGRNRAPASGAPSGFSLASMTCGMLSVTLCCTGILSIPTGALGILFAVLSARHGVPMHPMSRTGIRLCIIGILMGVILSIYSVYMVLNDPQSRQIFQETYQRYYNLYGS